MAKSTDECIKGLVAAFGKHGVTDADAEELVESIINERIDSTPISTMQAAEKLIRQALETADVLKADAMNNAAKRLAIRSFIDRFPIPENLRWYHKLPGQRIGKMLGLEGLISGVNTRAQQSIDGVARDFGNQYSTEAIWHGWKLKLVGGLYRELEANDVLKPFISGKLDLAIRWEWKNLRRETPEPSRDPQALKIARSLERWHEEGRLALNRAGARVKMLEDYSGRSTHDPWRLRNVEFDAWFADVLRTVDLKRTFKTENIERIERAAARWFEKLKRGDNLLAEDLESDAVRFSSGRSLARHREQHRVMHFINAETEHDYFKKYGAYKTLAELTWHTLDRVARDTALIGVWGRNPRDTFNRIAAQIKDELPDRLHDRYTADLKALQYRFDLLDGQGNKPANVTAANIANNYFALQRMAMFGSSAIVQITDSAFAMSALRYHGVPLAARLQHLTSRWMRGAEGTDRREVGELIGVWAESWLGNSANRLSTGDLAAGAIGRMENFFFHLNGMNNLERNSKDAMVSILARHYGMSKGKGWEELSDAQRRGLDIYAINKAEWELLRSADWKVVNKDYLTPKAVSGIEDSALEAYARTRGLIDSKTSDSGRTAAIARVRDELEMKLFAMYASEADHGIPTPGVNERATFRQGHQPGSAMAVALSFVGQVKAFISAVVYKNWGREVYGGQGAMGAVSGVIQTMVLATILGVIANMAYDLASARDPMARFRNKHPLQVAKDGYVRGGAGAFLGDWLLGEWSQYGKSFSGQLIGPAGRTLDVASEIWTRGWNGEDRAVFQGFQLARQNLPGQNLLWTKAAMDYLFVHALQEAINPGYLRRMERNLKERTGSEYIWAPSQTVR